MDIEESAHSLLLALPDPCLLAVMRSLADDDQRSLFSAARSHSRLHQAAVLTLSSITVAVAQQQQLDSVILYLHNHGEHVGSLDLYEQVSCPMGLLQVLELPQLPQTMQLTNLQLAHFSLRDQIGQLGGVAGMAALKKLRLIHCYTTVEDDGTWEESQTLLADLGQLPAGLEHLSLVGGQMEVPIDVFQQLRQLTYLELAGVALIGPGQFSVQAMVNLVDLQLNANVAAWPRYNVISACMLSGTHHLTRLELIDCSVEPDILAGKTRLQHLNLDESRLSGDSTRAEGQVAADATWVVGLLLHLQPMEQLTHLSLQRVITGGGMGNPHAEAFSALTASSKLRYLGAQSHECPAGVWQHMFPTGRQLPHLHTLHMPGRHRHDGPPSAAEGSRLVSCCPGLQLLSTFGSHFSVGLLLPLQGLSMLHTLRLVDSVDTSAEDVDSLCQLTGLRELSVFSAQQDTVTHTEGWLMQVTKLVQLTKLTHQSFDFKVDLISRAPDEEPLGRQLLRKYLNHSDPAVVQQAAAALAE